VGMLLGLSFIALLKSKIASALSPLASAAKEYVSHNATLSPILCCISGVNLQGLAIDNTVFYFL
jgi:hypothetical protein